MKIAARIISYLFHPMYMPIAGTIILFNSNLYLPNIYYKTVYFILIVLVLSSILMPLSLIPFYLQQKIIASIEMKTKKERILPLLLTSIIYFITFLLLHRIKVHTIVTGFILSAASAVFLCTIITFYYKISLHMLGIGGIIGLLLYISISHQGDTMVFIIPAILVSGLLGTARMLAGGHQPSEVYAGWGLGVLSVFAFMMIYVSGLSCLTN